jgi:hypothetical protein
MAREPPRLRLALAEAEHEAVPMPDARLVRDRLVALVAGGWADLDWSALGGLAARDAGLASSLDAGSAVARAWRCVICGIDPLRGINSSRSLAPRSSPPAALVISTSISQAGPCARAVGRVHVRRGRLYWPRAAPSLQATYRFGDAYVAAYVDTPPAFEAAGAKTEISTSFRSRAAILDHINARLKRYCLTKANADSRRSPPSNPTSRDRATSSRSTSTRHCEIARHAHLLEGGPLGPLRQAGARRNAAGLETGPGSICARAASIR